MDQILKEIYLDRLFLLQIRNGGKYGYSGISSRRWRKIIEIQLERLRTFKNHPFKVRMDQEMIRLSASVEKYGIINPLIVRPIPDGVYEIISGHRRKAAAEKFGYRKVPVIIRVMSDDEAVINMVDSNLQRQQITFSEKAFAYKMKNEAMKRTGGRRKSSQSDYPLKGKRQ